MQRPSYLVPFNEHPQLRAAVPEYMENELALDMRRLNRLTLLGCFDPEVQFDVYSGESSNHDTKIVGHVGNTALGGATKTTRAPLSKATYDESFDQPEFDPSEDYSTSAHWPVSLTVGVNRTALDDLVSSGKNRNTRDPKNWAGHLSTAIGNSVSTAAWQHLVTRTNIREIIKDAPTAGIATWWQSLTLHTSAGTLEGLAQYAAFDLIAVHMFSILNSKRRREDIPLKRRCWSVLPAAHIDRAVLVSGLAKALPVVRPLKT